MSDTRSWRITSVYRRNGIYYSCSRMSI